MHAPPPYIGRVTIFSWMFTIACYLVIGLRLGLGIRLNLVSPWLVVMHTYLYYFRLSLSHCHKICAWISCDYARLQPSWSRNDLRHCFTNDTSDDRRIKEFQKYAVDNTWQMCSLQELVAREKKDKRIYTHKNFATKQNQDTQYFWQD